MHIECTYNFRKLIKTTTEQLIDSWGKSEIDHVSSHVHATQKRCSNSTKNLSGSGHHPGNNTITACDSVRWWRSMTTTTTTTKWPMNGSRNEWKWKEITTYIFPTVKMVCETARIVLFVPVPGVYKWISVESTKKTNIAITCATNGINCALPQSGMIIIICWVIRRRMIRRSDGRWGGRTDGWGGGKCVYEMLKLNVTHNECVTSTNTYYYCTLAVHSQHPDTGTGSGSHTSYHIHIQNPQTLDKKLIWHKIEKMREKKKRKRKWKWKRE